MNPIEVTRQLQRSFVNYLLTTFDVNRDGRNAELAAEMRSVFSAPGALFNGPFLELTPPYVRGASLESLVESGVLDARVLQLPCFGQGLPLPPSARLYAHQEEAIRRITAERRSVVVSSGTGSGKTEAFLIPILNDLVRDRARGVRAVLIYPLNALVNDQLDRLRTLLAGTEITFGRYTSELVKTEAEARRQLGNSILPNEVICREQIRDGGVLPQILITNYAMLEYLLLRPEDSPLFASGAWRFLVLDEAHTYSGAKGIEVAMLVRRLKMRLGKQMGDMQCIATSATLADRPEDAVQFACDLFGEEFSVADIVVGSVDLTYADLSSDDVYAPDATCYLDSRLDAVLSSLRSETDYPADSLALYLNDIQLLDDAALQVADSGVANASAFLWHVLRRNVHVRRLLGWMLNQRDTPIKLTEAARQTFADDELSTEEEQLRALHNLIELGAMARPSAGESPLLPARYHVFARAPQGIWACVNPACPARHEQQKTVWSKLYTAPHDRCDSCGAAVYELAICRTCGQVYLRAAVEGADTSRLLTEVPEGADNSIRYLTWSSVEENAALAEDGVDEDQRSQATESRSSMRLERVEVCLNGDCRRTDQRCRCHHPRKVALYMLVDRQADRRGRIRQEAVTALGECVRCHDQPRVKDTEIATTMSANGSAPVSVLTTELYRRLPSSSVQALRQRPGGGRKLLTFYDSRQGAARFAAYLQDVFNQDVYRFLVPESIRRFATNGRTYPLDLMNLAEHCFEIGWNEVGVFQLDLNLERILEHSRSLSRNQREGVLSKIMGSILGEITTRQSNRLSLESLGLLKIEYFEQPPDITGLAGQIHLSLPNALKLVESLLDTLRREKAVTLPAGVGSDEQEFFGRHRGNPRICKARAQAGETPWIGTARHRRNRTVEKVLRRLGLPFDEKAVESVLATIWEWLVDCTDILSGSPERGYQISHNRLFFSWPEEGWLRCSKCQRLRRGGAGLPCLNPRCDGEMETIDRDEQFASNYYYYVMTQPVIPMRVEEHTAQLSPTQGRDYQNEFKNGAINILSCSTTFEMGIDLGDLQAVILNNVPPSVANYRQRAGRAGRRVGGAAFILTWASDQPHDQLYFSEPTAIIRGHVRVPRIALHNREIRRRHMYALLFAGFLRHLADDHSHFVHTLSALFDPQGPSPAAIDHLSRWLSDQEPRLIEQMNTFAIMLGDGMDQDASAVIRDFHVRLTKVGNDYLSVMKYYDDARRASDALVNDRSRSDAERNEARASRDGYERLADRLADDEEPINFLSARGLLPSYAFPLYTSELILPPTDEGKRLRLQRELRLAIKEYAPGAEVVANKRLWRSEGLQFYQDAPQLYSYRLCRTCNNLNIGSAPGVEIGDHQCPVCGTSYRDNHTPTGHYLKPDAFRAARNSGTPAGQYIRRDPGTIRTALWLGTTGTPEQMGTLLQVGYVSNDESRLFFVNEGEFGKGYHICTRCGTASKDPRRGCRGYHRGARCSAQAEEVRPVMLGHDQQTDTLHLRFLSTSEVRFPPQDRPFWVTMLYALLRGASRALQIEPRDISGVLHPVLDDAGSWHQTIVLYDNVPGGAGHVRDIRNHLREVFVQALQVVQCGECGLETSCVHCLRDYDNQHYYTDLKRSLAIRPLEALIADLENAASPSSTIAVVAADRARWLMTQLTEATQEVWIAADGLELPENENTEDSWLDLLYGLLRRGVAVHVLIRETPRPSTMQPASLQVAQFLRALVSVGPGLQLTRISRLPEWQVVIWSETRFKRAIRAERGDKLLLGVSMGRERMWTTSRDADVDAARQQLVTAERSGVPVTSDELLLPPRVQVYNIRSGPARKERDFEGICAFYSQPLAIMKVNDPYLDDRYSIFDRLGAHIELAYESGTLREVIVTTKDARNGRAQQDAAFEELRRKFADVSIRLHRPPEVEHDRFIEIIRVDGSRARMLIGRGLDFIQNDRVLTTYIVTEEL